MAGTPRKRAGASSSRRSTGPARPPEKGGSRTLILIDNKSLQEQAWKEFHAAKKKHDKTAEELHRHEQVDVPAYDSWLHRTFPVEISTLRDLAQRIEKIERDIGTVEMLASFTGQSARVIWREFKQDPEGYLRRTKKEMQDEVGSDDGDQDDDFDDDDDADDWSTEDADGMPNGSEPPPKQDRKSRGRAAFDEDDIWEQPKAAKRPVPKEAKEIYRRLVQLLHPDRGGEWTATRERIWHEVQQAWELRDADWLARLEVEWETANDKLTPTSPISRLRRAIRELMAARRDIERKLRLYRTEPPWRFSLAAKHRKKLYDVTSESFEHDILLLKRKLAILEDIIEGWEKPLPKKAKRPAPFRPISNGPKVRRRNDWVDDAWY